MKILEMKKLKRLYKLTLDDFISVTEADGTEKSTDTLYITEDTIVKFMLSKGSDYDAKELADIMAFASYSRGKNAAIYFISFKSRTRSEVEKYLRGHEVPETDIPKILDELEELQFINDAAYVERAVTAALLAEKNGPYHIKQKLLQRGLAADLIDNTLQEQYSEEKQLSIAAKLAAKEAASKAARLPQKMLQQKITQSLVAKGFSYSIAALALETIEFEPDEENEQSLLAAEAEKLYNRLSKRYEGYILKQHISQSLGRKGFDWGDISDALQDFEF